MSAAPPLRNDCFALPPGVDWVPMATALERLRDRLTPVTASETAPLDQALAGRLLAADVTALRANPPADNSAVDGYAFTGPAPEGLVSFPLVEGRSAAGQPLEEAVPPGHAVRILTGAILPPGVDTVVLQEDVALDAGRVAFHGPLKAGANARKAGEDVVPGQALLAAGRRITPADLALMASAGLAEVPVRAQLRVGVLSNGDEVIAPGAIPPDRMGRGKIYDANRPMLLAQLAAWGYAPVDLGTAPDTRDGLRTRLNEAAGQVDAILSSGGVSTGDEDHVSALLRGEGQIDTWRIAIKPGRPLALGLWQGTPLIGLPGNPVAALVCTLLFAHPALRRLAGGDWPTPQGFTVPAAFSKKKKPGRAEYLRARMTADGTVEAFASEGSGRISGLSWAEGLVELDDGARQIHPGDPVRFLPYASFD